MISLQTRLLVSTALTTGESCKGSTEATKAFGDPKARDQGSERLWMELRVCIHSTTGASCGCPRK